MSSIRRSDASSRRRRVLVYRSCLEGSDGSGASRQDVEKLRQARRPAATYGTSVNRPLRGKWFSLVPVRFRAFAAVSLAVFALTAGLCVAHWLAIRWPPLVYREAVARPLRLDRPDSFGTWVRACLLVLASGTSFLIYQLRRYRNDDFRGSYRIWPPLIVLAALAGVDTVCALVPWCGELIDLALGKRVALAGVDWLRIAITVGGAALALRLSAEVRHSRAALAFLLAALGCFATPAAAHWGLAAADTPLKWWWITSAPLVGAATLWLSYLAYLRKLFREVRRIDVRDAAALVAARQSWRLRPVWPWRRSEETEAQRAKVKPATIKMKPKPPAGSQAGSRSSAADNADTASPEAAESPAKRRRSLFAPWRWFGRREKKRPAASESVAADKNSADCDKSADANKDAPAASNPDTAKPGADGSTKRKRFRPFGLLFGWVRIGRKSKSAEGNAAEGGRGQRLRPSPSAADSGSSEESDQSEIDWGAMSKAERRRMRREMKRSGEAA